MIKIKDWEKLDKLGEGAYGEVYKVFNPETEETCALKVIRVPKDDEEDSRLKADYPDDDSRKKYLQNEVEILIREIELMKSLKGHKNIVALQEYEVEPFAEGIGWTLYIRMELLNTFNDYMAENVQDESALIRLGIEVCNALEECDRLKIIHRDIKPDNILVSDDGTFKLADFGIARTMEKTMTVMTKRGTYAFMAPEIFHGEKYSKNVDIYSLGIMLYRLCNNNREPFISADKKIVYFRDREAAMEKRMTGEVMPSPAKASERMAEIILKACAYRPENRYGSASELKKDLELLRDGKYRLKKAEYISEEEQRQKDEEKKQQELEIRVAKETTGKWRRISVVSLVISSVIVFSVLVGFWLDKTAVETKAIPYVSNIAAEDENLSKKAERAASVYEGWLWECLAANDFERYAADTEYGVVPENMFEILRQYYYKPELTGRQNESHFIQQKDTYYQIETVRYYVDGYYGSEADFTNASINQVCLQWNLKYNSVDGSFSTIGDSEAVELKQAVLDLYPEGYKEAVENDRYYVDSGQRSSLIGDMVYDGVFNYSAVAMWEDENGLLNALISIKNGTKESGNLNSIELAVTNAAGENLVLANVESKDIEGNTIIEPLNNDNYVMTNISLEDQDLTLEDLEGITGITVNVVVNE